MMDCIHHNTDLNNLVMINTTIVNAYIYDSNTLDDYVSYNKVLMETVSEVNVKSGHKNHFYSSNSTVICHDSVMIKSIH